MDNKKSNKGLIIALIIIIVVMFFTIIGLGFSLMLQSYRCNVANRVYDTIDSTEKTIKDVTKGLVKIITKETKNGIKFPYVNFDSDFAEEINDDIEDFFDEIGDVDDVDTSFKTYTNGDIESIVVKYNLHGDNNRYRAYNINKKTGKKVTAEDLMNQKDMTLDNIKIRMKAIWMQKVKKSEGYSMRIESDYSTTVEQATKNNIDKLTKDNIVLYLNSEGHLCVIYEEYQIAGAETGFYIMDLDKYLYTELK